MNYHWNGSAVFACAAESIRLRCYVLDMRMLLVLLMLMFFGGSATGARRSWVDLPDPMDLAFFEYQEAVITVVQQHWPASKLTRFAPFTVTLEGSVDGRLHPIPKDQWGCTPEIREIVSRALEKVCLPMFPEVLAKGWFHENEVSSLFLTIRGSGSSGPDVSIIPLNRTHNTKGGLVPGFMGYLSHGNPEDMMYSFLVGDYWKETDLGESEHLRLNADHSFQVSLRRKHGASREFKGWAHVSSEQLHMIYDDTETARPARRLVPLEWGERLYLLAPGSLSDFAAAIRRRSEPRTCADGPTFLREGDWNTKVEGLPNLPEPWKSQCSQ